MATWSELKIKLIETGDETGTWGETTNENFNNVIQQAITGSAAVSFSDADVTLPLADTTDLQNARALRLSLTGTVTAPRTLYVPNIQKFYLIDNGLTEAITVQNTVGAGAALTIPAGRSTLVFNDATDIINPNTYFAGAILSDAAVILGGAINATPIGGLSTSTGAFTTLDATTLTLTNALAVAEGGTGVALSTGTTKVVLSDSPTITSPSISDANLTGIPVAPTAAALTNTTQVATTAFVTGAISDKNLGTMSTQNANAVAITGGTITGITDLAVADGGTGSSTLAANNVLLGNNTNALQVVAPGSSGNLLTSNGTTWTSTTKTITSSTVVTLSGQTTVDFTSIPSWVKRVTLIFNEVDVSGSDIIQVVLGTVSSFETTGYISTFTSTVTSWASTTSFEISQPQVALSGIVTFANISGNTWIASGAGKSGTSRMFVGGGSKTLADTLTRLQIKASGSNTLSTGSLNIFYE